MIVAVTGAGGGVGTSTLALLLTVALAETAADDQEAALVEVDRAGGVAGARFDIGVDNGLHDWAAGLATDPSTPIGQYGKRLGERLRAVPGPMAPADAERVLTPVVQELIAAAMTADRSRLWVVDVGRGGAGATPIVDAADGVVVVTNGLPEQVVRLPSLVQRCASTPCIVMVGGRSSWPIDEIQDHAGASAVLDGPEFRLSVDQVIALVEGRKRRRSLQWRSVLRCRDAVLQATLAGRDTPGAVRTTTPDRPVAERRSTG